MAELRPNRMRRKLLKGEVATCLYGIDDLDMVESIASLGIVDGFMIEIEHGATTWADLSDFSRACDLWGVTSMAKLGNPPMPFNLSRTLDRGLQGFGVSRVNTREQIQQIVRYSRFAPVGMRGIGGGRQGLGVPDYLRKANDEILIVAWIEDVEAIRNLPQILSVEGIDAFLVGPGDLAQTMGHQYLGKSDHPDVNAVADKAVQEIVKAGKVASVFVNDATMDHYLDLGVRMLLFGAQGYMMAGITNFQKKVAAKAAAIKAPARR